MIIEAQPTTLLLVTRLSGIPQLVLGPGCDVAAAAAGRCWGCAAQWSAGAADHDTLSHDLIRYRSYEWNADPTCSVVFNLKQSFDDFELYICAKVGVIYIIFSLMCKHLFTVKKTRFCSGPRACSLRAPALRPIVGRDLWGTERRPKQWCGPENWALELDFLFFNSE